MPPKRTARQRAVELHEQGQSQVQVRQQMALEGFSKSLLSQVLTPWPPQMGARALAAAAKRAVPAAHGEDAAAAIPLAVAVEEDAWEHVCSNITIGGKTYKITQM